MKKTILSIVLLIWVPFALAIVPYMKGENVTAGDLKRAMQQVENKLRAAGFNPAGTFTPSGLEGYGVVVVTDKEILDAIATQVRHILPDTPPDLETIA